MPIIAKCNNYTGCLRAYRGEEIELADGMPLVCPECGKPLQVVPPGPTALRRLVPWVVYLALLAVGLWIARPFLVKLISRKPATPSSVATPAPTPQGLSPREPAAAPKSEPVSEPPAAVTSPAQIDMDLAKAENKKVKEEVLTRVDLMPNLSQSNRDKLYNSVERARSMGKVVTIPFKAGQTALNAGDVQALKAELDKPEIMKLRDDPTAVFVILGFADPKGDEKKNLAISQTRADAVLKAMQEKGGVMNVMHAVAMGGSKLVDAQNLEKNRVVEVWAVLP